MLLKLIWLQFLLLIFHVSAFSPPGHIYQINPHTSKLSRHQIHHGPLKQRSNRLVILDESSSSNCNDSGSSEENNDDLSLFIELMSPISSAQPDQMSASSLAYLGDVVFELFIRSRYVWPQRRMPVLQNTVVGLVNAEAQSKLLQKFVDNFTLTSAEQAVLARGRNASLTARKKGKGGESMYQDSTAFEALLGYTYINDKVRFTEMISWMKLELDKMDGM